MSEWLDNGTYDVIGPLNDPLLVLPGDVPPALKVHEADQWPFDGDPRDEDGGDDE